MKSLDELLNNMETTVSLSSWQRDEIVRMMNTQDTLDATLAALQEEEEQTKKKTPAELRKKYPVLKDAYDQYRMVLKLVQQDEE